MATRTISTKLAIEGEGEYRAAITRINTELKTLQSNLKLTENQYQTNANTVQALQAKHDALSGVIEAQKRKVEELRKALDNAKSAQETYAQNCANLRERIEANDAAMEKLKSSSADTSKEQKALAEETAKLRKELEEEESKLAAAEKGANSWQTQLNNAEIKLNDLDAELQKNDKYLDEAKSSADGCAKSIDEYGKEVKESAEATEKQNDALEALAAALAAAGVKAGIDEITEALKACVDASAQFEAGMSAVGAIANATSDEMDLLSQKAKEIGASTKFTASEASEAMQYMALAGWSAQEMLQGVDGVINLAAASGENLAAVSDIVTDALTAFGLKAQDSEHFVDVLAKTAASSNTTVTMLGDAFKYAAPLAGALGYSVEDVAVAVGLMANQGIKGSQAGTALRTMFTKLTGEIKLTGEAFGEATVSASNADGSMKPLSQTLQELREYFNQMTQAEKLQNAEAIAGKYAMSGLTAVMNSTEEDFASLTAVIQDCNGVAEEMAKIRMDNLEGQVTLMKSAFDALKIAVGDDLNPALRGLAEKGTDVLTWAAEFVEEHKELVPVISAVTAGVVALTGALAAIAVVKTLTPLITAFNAALAANPATLVAVAITSLVAALVALNATMPQTENEYQGLTSASKDQYDKLQALNTEYEKACKLYGESSVEAQALAAQIDAETNIYNRNKETLSDLVGKTDALIASSQKLRQESEGNAEAIDKSYESNSYLIGRLQELTSEEEKTYGTKQQILAIVEILNQRIPGLSLAYDEYSDKLNLTTDALIDLAKAEADRQRAAANFQRQVELEKTQADISAQLIKVRSDLASAEDRLAAATQRKNDALSKYSDQELLMMSYNVGGAVDQYVDAVVNAQNEVTTLSAKEQALTEEYQANAEEIRRLAGAQEELTKAKEDDAKTGQDAAAALSKSLQELATEYKQAYDAAKESYDGQFTLCEEVGTLADQSAREVADAFEKAWDDAYKAAEKSIEGQFGTFEEFKGVTVKNIGDMKTAIESQIQYWGWYDDTLNEILNSGIDGIDDFVQHWLDGSTQSAAEMAGFVNASDEERRELISQWQEVQNKQADVAEGIAELKTRGSSDMAELAEATGKSVEDMIAAQKSQQEYWLEYTQNLESLKSRNVEGIDELAKAYSDGSVESAQALATLNSATDEQLSALVSSMNRTDELRSDLASTAADLETNFKEKLDLLVSDYEGTMQALTDKSGDVDFSPFLAEAQRQFSEAGVEIQKSTEEAGKNADLGFQNGLVSGSGEVYTAASSVGQAVIDALIEVLDEHSPSKKTEDIGENADTGLAQGIANRADQVTGAAEDLGTQLTERMSSAGRNAVDGFDSEYSQLEEHVREGLEATRLVVEEFGWTLAGDGQNIGAEMIDGMADGIYGESGYLYSAICDVVSNAIEEARRAADTHSPSRKTEKIFEDVGEGMVVGVEKKKKRVAEATQDVVDDALRIDTSGMIDAIRMLDARKPDLSSMLYQSSRTSAAPRTGDVYVSVNIPEMVVREEADIEKISQAMAKQVAFALRQKGR